MHARYVKPQCVCNITLHTLCRVTYFSLTWKEESYRTTAQSARIIAHKIRVTRLRGFTQRERIATMEIVEHTGVSQARSLPASHVNRFKRTHSRCYSRIVRSPLPRFFPSTSQTSGRRHTKNNPADAISIYLVEVMKLRTICNKRDKLAGASDNSDDHF